MGGPSINMTNGSSRPYSGPVPIIIEEHLAGRTKSGRGPDLARGPCLARGCMNGCLRREELLNCHATMDLCSIIGGG